MVRDSDNSQWEGLRRHFDTFVPYNKALGLTIDELGRGMGQMRLPYDPQLVGDPKTGVVHGGAITSLMDACGGVAVFTKLDVAIPIATLDLRIDYVKPATPKRDIIARATCYKLTRNVAFVRGVAFHDDENDAIASAAATFMLSTPLHRGQRKRAPE